MLATQKMCTQASCKNSAHAPTKSSFFSHKCSHVSSCKYDKTAAPWISWHWHYVVAMGFGVCRRRIRDTFFGMQMGAIGRWHYEHTGGLYHLWARCKQLHSCTAIHSAYNRNEKHLISSSVCVCNFSASWVAFLLAPKAHYHTVSIEWEETCPFVALSTCLYFLRSEIDSAYLISHFHLVY